MIPVSKAFRDAVKANKPQRAVLKFENATFTNEDISVTSGGITFTERFNEATDLTMGVAPSSGLRVQLINRDGALDDFPFGKFTASIGACVEETHDEFSGNCRAEYNGRVFTGHNEPPYLREDGQTCQVQPDFPVLGILIDGNTVYCVGAGGRLFAFLITSYAYIVIEGTWDYRKTRTWRELLPLTWYKVMNEAVDLSDETLLKKLNEIGKRTYSLTFGDGTVTEYWNDGTKRVYELVKLGTFVADRPAVVKKRIIDLEANDQMVLFDKIKAEEAGFTYPTTLGGLLQQACAKADVPLKSASFLNSDLAVSQAPEEFEEATLREVVAWIAEAACAYARFDREGLLEIVWFSDTTESYDEHDYSDFTPYSYEVETVQQLNVRNQNSTGEAILGSGENAYMVQNNPFLRLPDKPKESKTSVADKPMATADGGKGDGSGTEGSGQEEVRDASEANASVIYDRLSSFPRFHPSSADLFTDWSVQAGDVVSVSSDGESYRLPVYTMTMNWTGSPKITMESSGNEKREPLSKWERQSFHSGAGGYQNQQDLEELQTWAELTIDEQQALIEANAGSIQQLGDDLETFRTDVGARFDGLEGTIDLWAERINQNTNDITQANIRIDGVQATIDLHTSKISELEGRMSEAFIQINGANATITEYAGRFDKIEGRLSSAEITINGAEGTIGLTTLVANLNDDMEGLSHDYETLSGLVDELGESVSGALINISAAEANIKEWAGRTEVIENEQGDLEKRVTQAELDIDGANAAITLKADSSIVTDLGERLASAEVDINGMEGEIALKVSKNGIISAINMSSESVTISSSKINLEGLVTASQLETAIASFDYVAGGFTVQGTMDVGGYVNAGGVSIESWSSFQVDGASAGLGQAIKSFGQATSSDGKITIPTTTLSGLEGPPINFNIADTQFYQDGVSAAASTVELSGSWSGVTYTVDATNGKSASTTIGATWLSSYASYNPSTHKYDISIPVRAYGGGMNYGEVLRIEGSTGTDAYDDGKTEGGVSFGSVKLERYSSSLSTMFSAVAYDSNDKQLGTKAYGTLSLSSAPYSSSSTVSARTNGVEIASISVGSVYSAGYTAGSSAGGATTAYVRLEGTNQTTFSAQAYKDASYSQTLGSSITGYLYTSGSNSSTVVHVGRTSNGNSVAQINVGSLYSAGYDDGSPKATGDISGEYIYPGNWYVVTVPIKNKNGDVIYTAAGTLTTTEAFNTGYTNGANTVTLDNGKWEAEGTLTSSTWTVSASNGASRSLTVRIAEDDWTDGKKMVYAYGGDTVAGFLQITAPSSSVELSSKWTGSSSNAYNTYQVTASPGGSKSISLYLTVGSWMSGSLGKYAPVYLREGSPTGTIRARTTVNEPKT